MAFFFSLFGGGVVAVVLLAEWRVGRGGAGGEGVPCAKPSRAYLHPPPAHVGRGCFPTVLSAEWYAYLSAAVWLLTSCADDHLGIWNTRAVLFGIRKKPCLVTRIFPVDIYFPPGVFLAYGCVSWSG